MPEGESVSLRPVTRDDLALLSRWDKDSEVTRYLGRTFERRGGVQAWFRRSITDPSCLAQAITTSGGRLIGYLTLDDISWRAGSGELKICLGEKTIWNQGYGTAAVSAFLDGVREFGLREIVVRVYTGHQAAVRCYEKSGFRREGVLRGGRVAPSEEMYLMRWRVDAAVGGLMSAERA